MTVLRWHQNPNPALRNSGDTIDAHQHRVCDLCHQIAARIGLKLVGSDLPRSALKHDEAERVLGDPPAPAKARFPALAQAYADAEIIVMAEMGIPPFDLTTLEAEILDIADKADAWRWATMHGAAHTPEWQEAKRKLYAACSKIGADGWWGGFVAEVDTLTCGTSTR